MQPLTSLQLSTVQRLPSSQSSVAPALQLPPLQRSGPLQALPSSQALPFGSLAVQESTASSQDSAQLPSPSAPWQGSPAWPSQLPLLQLSLPLQKRWSSQVAALFEAWQSPLALHSLSVQGLPSSVQPVPSAT